jgi:hypothetical protein
MLLANRRIDRHHARGARWRLTLAAVVLPLVIVGCSGYTTPPQGVKRVRAWLHATVSCADGEHCSGYFRWGTAGSSLPNRTPTLGPFPGPVTDFDWAQEVTTLQPNVVYEYQFCGNNQQNGGFVCVGPSGGDTRQRFKTPTFYDSFENTSEFPEEYATGAWMSSPTLSGSGAYVSQVTPSGYSAVDGSKVAEAGLTTSSVRAELQCHRSAAYGPDNICAGGPGSELFYEWSFRIPSSVAIPDQPHPRRPNIMQTKPEQGSATSCYGGGLVVWRHPTDPNQFELRQNVRGGTIVGDEQTGCTFDTADTVYYLGSYAKDAWHRVLLHAKWSATSSGFEEMWIDGDPVMPRQNRPTVPTTLTKEDFRLGIYNSVNNSGGTNWHVDYDDVRIGVGSPF